MYIIIIPARRQQQKSEKKVEKINKSLFYNRFRAQRYDCIHTIKINSSSIHLKSYISHMIFTFPTDVHAESTAAVAVIALLVLSLFILLHFNAAGCADEVIAEAFYMNVCCCLVFDMGFR